MPESYTGAVKLSRKFFRIVVRQNLKPEKPGKTEKILKVFDIFLENKTHLIKLKY
jgi:hypothetical protein